MSKIYTTANGARYQLSPDQRVHVYPAGGGFGGSLPLETFLADFKEEVEPPPYRLVKVTIDGDLDFTFNAYCDARRWNGWAVPYFTKSEAEKVLARMREFNEVKEIENGYTITDSHDPEIVYEATFTTIPGVTVPVINLMDGWCWDIVEEGDL